jgi:hypothetical protein
MKEALSSSETSVLSRTTRRNILEDAVLLSARSSLGEKSHWVERPDIIPAV